MLTAGALLTQSLDDSAFQWRDDSLHAAASASEPSDVARALEQLLRAPATSSTASARDTTVDTNHTLELNIALNAIRDSEDLASSVRTDVDVLERLWGFALVNVADAEMAVATVRALLATTVAPRAIPLVHPDNPTRLGAILKQRADASVNRAGDTTAALEHELSRPREALLALVELGAWTLERDVVAWFAQIGFTAVECAQIVEQLALSTLRSDSTERRLHARAMTQELVDVCALASSLGISGSLVRMLASDCLGSAATRERSTDAPAFVASLSEFVPDRIRSNLGGTSVRPSCQSTTPAHAGMVLCCHTDARRGDVDADGADALFWDLEMSFGALMERSVRVCDASFHASCCRSQPLERTGSSDERIELKAMHARVDAALVLTSETLAQLERQLPAATLQLPAVQSFLQHQQQLQTLDYALPLSSGLALLLESTTRSLLA